jgi:hypothetical protein
MDPVWWVVVCVVSALNAGGLVYFVMRSHMDVLLSKQREELAEARASLAAQKEAIEVSLKNVEESTRRKALDEFMAEIRVEERHYVRENKTLFLNRKAVVRQERVFFRNIPLCNWIEQEMPIEEGMDLEKIAQTMAMFAPELLFGPPPPPPNPKKKLR